MNKRLKHAINTFCDVAEYLNNQIRQGGEIQKNNHELWNEYLHQFDNNDWINLYFVISSLSDTKHIKGSHIDLFDEIIDQIDRLGEYYDRVMDLNKKGYVRNKPMAWKGILSVREIYNDICGIYLPNDDSSKQTHKETLFEIGE